MRNYNYVVISRVLCALIPDSERVELLGRICMHLSLHPGRAFTEAGYDYFCKKLNALEKEYGTSPEVWGS